MPDFILNEEFGRGEFSPQLKWFCPPPRWQVENSKLVAWPAADTDYWQRTEYGFIHDNGHFLYLPVDGDFTMTTHVVYHPQHQYDQAGLMVRFSPECWLKTSVEYEPEKPAYLGAVVTNRGYSDWSTQVFSNKETEFLLRVRRVKDTFYVEQAAAEGSAWNPIRLARLDEADGTAAPMCGVYTCSPIAAGLQAEFLYLRIEKE